VFLFDESTSALDTDTESSVFSNLKPILAAHTSLSIAHRLSTIEDAREILVLQNGRIIEKGDYGELMQKKGVFYRMAKGR
jgi:ABC-type transport system involved in Fe-S cluster assembly fused permease/ATPase subunit